MIRVENLKKDFGRLQVLKGVTEEIRQNEVVSIIGPSGSGKSTLLRCLNLLEVPSSGKIYFHEDVYKRQGIGRRPGGNCKILFQGAGIFT